MREVKERVREREERMKGREGKGGNWRVQAPKYFGLDPPLYKVYNFAPILLCRSFRQCYEDYSCWSHLLINLRA